MDLFRCPKIPGGLTLTTEACATSWKKSRHAKPWDGIRWYCSGCDIGMANANADACAAVKKICSCCKKPARRYILGMLCISCYNRMIEIITGKDRRMNAPLFGVREVIGAVVSATYNGVRMCRSLYCRTSRDSHIGVLFSRAPIKYGGVA